MSPSQSDPQKQSQVRSNPEQQPGQATTRQSSPAGAQQPGQGGAELMRPGPEHTRLAKNLGTWDVGFTHWMKEGAEPLSGQGTAVLSSLFDGRYIREIFTTHFNGEPFQGVGTMGYDRAAKEYVQVWYDSAGTGLTRTSGTASPDGREVVLTGSMTCPMAGTAITVRHVRRQETDDRFTVVMFNAQDGRERKAMELTYTRKQ